jgi:hypothetical protein
MQRQLAQLIPAGIHTGIGAARVQLEGDPPHLGHRLEQPDRLLGDLGQADALA